MKRAIRIFFIVFGLVALWASTSRDAMRRLTDLRDVNTWWGTYQCLNGDLVSMSYLDFVKQFNPGPDAVHLKTVSRSPADSTILFMHGDSYTWHVGDSNFTGVKSLIYINRDHGCNYHLDTLQRNILVIEISERFVWDYFQSLRMFDEVCDSFIKKKNIVFSPADWSAPSYAALGGPFSVDDVFNKYINQNLQYNLFNYQFVMPLFESKAALNYYVFNRASGDVVISDDRDCLFLRGTVSYDGSGSSYMPVTGDQVARLVSNFNAVYDHYRGSGFREVYLSIIPNPATIRQPGGYNMLIPRLQTDSRLRMKTIDVYSVFKASPQNLYYNGDTHWNNKGKQIWIDLVNDRLRH